MTSFSTCDETVVSDAASSIVELETSSLRELSSSPLVEAAVEGDSDGDDSDSSTGC